jgi:hypothetical protein
MRIENWLALVTTLDEAAYQALSPKAHLTARFNFNNLFGPTTNPDLTTIAASATPKEAHKDVGNVRNNHAELLNSA